MWLILSMPIYIDIMLVWRFSVCIHLCVHKYAWLMDFVWVYIYMYIGTLVWKGLACAASASFYILVILLVVIRHLLTFVIVQLDRNRPFDRLEQILTLLGFFDSVGLFLWWIVGDNGCRTCMSLIRKFGFVYICF